MSRARSGITKCDVDRIAKAAKEFGVPIRGEHIAPDGSRWIITAGDKPVEATATADGETDGEANGVSDLDKWISRYARANEGT